MNKLGDLMTAFGHLIRRGLAARLSYRVKSSPEKHSSAISNAARFEPQASVMQQNCISSDYMFSRVTSPHYTSSIQFLSSIGLIGAWSNLHQGYKISFWKQDKTVTFGFQGWWQISLPGNFSCPYNLVLNFGLCQPKIGRAHV